MATPVIIVLFIWFLLAEFLGASRLPGPYTTLELFVTTTTHDSIIEAQGGGSGGYLPMWLPPPGRSSRASLAALFLRFP